MDTSTKRQELLRAIGDVSDNVITLADSLPSMLVNPHTGQLASQHTEISLGAVCKVNIIFMGSAIPQENLTDDEHELLYLVAQELLQQARRRIS